MTITGDTSQLYKIRAFLPQRISGALSRLDKSTLDKISEIRLRRDAITTVTIEGKNLLLTLSGISGKKGEAIKPTKEEIEDFIYRFCKGSVYSHEATLSEYFLVNDSVRVGIAGNAFIKDGSIISVESISSICIRLPRHISGCSKKIADHIKENGFPEGKGILIASKPGVGKTTFLRDLAKALSCDTETGLRRVCVIDERHEIFMEKIFSDCCIDFISGVGKIKGMEIAARVLSPEIIICDEISGPDEAEKIIRRKNGGIVFIASVHSDSYEDVFSKDYLKRMFEEGVFSHLCVLIRTHTGVDSVLCEYHA